MAFNQEQMLDVLNTMDGFLAHMRPPADIRPKLDYGYAINDQTIVVNEIRPFFKGPEIIMHLPVAKATYIRTKNHWKVFWMRANGKWESYPPKPTVRSLKQFCKLVIDDDHACFFG